MGITIEFWTIKLVRHEIIFSDRGVFNENYIVEPFSMSFCSLTFAGDLVVPKKSRQKTKQRCGHY